MTDADTALPDTVHTQGITGLCMAAFVLETSTSFRVQKLLLQNCFPVALHPVSLDLRSHLCP